MENIKILCIHGIGAKELDLQWSEDWIRAFEKMKFSQRDRIKFLEFDDFFKGSNANWRDYVYFFHKTFIERKRYKGLKNWMDNYPDMVVEFLLNKNEIREALRNQLKKQIETDNPDVIFAHSLGGMICYDFFTQPENSTQYKNIIIVTAGTQLGNPKLKNHNLKQPLEMMPLKFWYNLNNPKDRVFARYPIKLSDNNYFKEITTEFKNSVINHDGLEYIINTESINKVWNEIRLLLIPFRRLYEK